LTNPADPWRTAAAESRFARGPAPAAARCGERTSRTRRGRSLHRRWVREEAGLESPGREPGGAGAWRRRLVARRGAAPRGRCRRAAL